MESELMRTRPDREIVSNSHPQQLTISQLTPGDFVTTFRRIRFSQPDADADEIIQILADEVKQRDVGRQRRIGFEA